MYKSIISIVMTLLLFGCSDGTPMKITEQHSNMDIYIIACCFLTGAGLIIFGVFN